MRGIAQAVSNWHYRRADRLIAMSHSLAKRLSEVSKKPLDSIAINPQYCEDFYAQPADCSALRRQFGDKFHLILRATLASPKSGNGY